MIFTRKPYQIDSVYFEDNTLKIGCQCKEYTEALTGGKACFTDSKGKVHKVGSCDFSDFTCFSFHPVKHIATGEGGAVTLNDPDLYRRAMLYRTHGIT